MAPTDDRTDRDALADVFAAHRHEIHVHCYRMTGSLTDAEDLTHDVFIRAWRGLDHFDHRASLRTWLYRIATNTCIDYLRSAQRRARPTASVEQTLEQEAWIDPYPDRTDPAEQLIRHETTDLSLVAALAHLPPRQRAAVIARDLLELDARHAAEVLGCSTAAVNSLLQRARRRMRELDMSPGHPAIAAPDDDLIRAYIDAHHRGDVATIVALLAADIRITMPPEPPCHGIAEAERFFAHILGVDGPGAWKLTPGRANGTHATINTVRPPGAEESHLISIDLLTTADGRITAIRCFIEPTSVRAFAALAGHPTTAP